MDQSILVLVAGAVAAGFVQGLSGFAFGLVATSIWAWSLDPQLAAALSVSGAFIGQVIAALTVRRSVDLRLLAPFLIGGVMGLPIGIMILPLLDVTLYKAGLGTVLVVWCPAMLVARQFHPIASRKRFGDGIAGLLGGVLGGVGGFAGLVPTLWCTLSRVEKVTQRAIVQNFNLAMLSFAMAGYVETGKITATMLPEVAVVAVAVIVPTLVGARVYVGVSEATFRTVVLSLLTLSGVALLVSAATAEVGR